MTTSSASTIATILLIVFYAGLVLSFIARSEWQAFRIRRHQRRIWKTPPTP